MNYETGEIAYIPCCSCQVNIKCVQPYCCSHHMSNFLNSTFHVMCNNGDNVTSTSDVQSTTRNKNFICLFVFAVKASNIFVRNKLTLSDQPLMKCPPHNGMSSS